MLNECSFIGHLGRDPEIRSLQSGDRVCNLSLGVSDSWTDKQTGERKTKTEWVRVVIFNDGLAGVCEKYLNKGSKIYISGQLQTRKWTDQQGQERYTSEIVLQKFGGKLIMLDSKREGVSAGDGWVPPEGSGAGIGGLDDEISFAPLMELP